MAYPYASIFTRGMAQVLNAMVIIACLSPVLYLFNFLFQPSVHQPLAYALFSMLRSLLVFSSVVACMAWFNHRYGGTPGKCLLGLKVVNEKTGEYLNMAQAVTRVVLALVSMASVVGVLFMLFDARKRTLHDRLMGSIVVVHEDDYAELPLNSDQLDSLDHGHPQ